MGIDTSEVIRRDFPRYAGQNNLPTQVEKQVEEWVDASMEMLIQKREEEDIPRLAGEFRK